MAKLFFHFASIIPSQFIRNIHKQVSRLNRSISSWWCHEKPIFKMLINTRIGSIQREFLNPLYKLQNAIFLSLLFRLLWDVLFKCSSDCGAKAWCSSFILSQTNYLEKGEWDIFAKLMSLHTASAHRAERFLAPASRVKHLGRTWLAPDTTSNLFLGSIVITEMIEVRQKDRFRVSTVNRLNFFTNSIRTIP